MKLDRFLKYLALYYGQIAVASVAVWGIPLYPWIFTGFCFGIGAYQGGQLYRWVVDMEGGE